MTMRSNYHPIHLFRTVADISELPLDSYGLPSHGYFPLADFIVKTAQVTVIGTEEQLTKMREFLPTRRRVILLWIVPRETFCDFQWVARLESVDQYKMITSLLYP